MTSKVTVPGSAPLPAVADSALSLDDVAFIADQAVPAAKAPAAVDMPRNAALIDW